MTNNEQSMIQIDKVCKEMECLAAKYEQLGSKRDDLSMKYNRGEVPFMKYVCTKARLTNERKAIRRRLIFLDEKATAIFAFAMESVSDNTTNCA